MSSYFPSSSLSSRLIMMLSFHCGAGLSGCYGKWVHTLAVGPERKKYRHLFLWLIQYGTRGKCPSSCCNDFFITFLNCWFTHMSIFNWTQSVPSRSNNMPHTRQCWGLNHKLSHKILGLLCAELHDYKQKCHRLRRHKTGIRIRLWRAFIGRWRQVTLLT